MKSSRSNLLKEISIGEDLSLTTRKDLDLWPELEALRSTQQDESFHSEGNVLIHTEMVLNECKAIDIPNKAPLYLSALLHDIAKPETTKFDEDYGHIIAPGHERIGGIQTRYLLRELSSLSNQERRLISQLVATHHLVKRAVKKFENNDSDAISFLENLAARVDTRYLWALELADMRGRICVDQNRQIEIVELFKMLCEENDCFGKPPTPWLSKKDVQEMSFYTFSAEHYSLKEIHRRRLAGTMKDIHEAKAFCWDRAKADRAKVGSVPVEVIITIGASGSGKSTQTKNCSRIISTDAIRKQLYGKESIIGDGEVFQVCMEKLKTELRNSWIDGGYQVVYDATNIIPDLRKKIVDVCHNYGAYVTFWVFDISKEKLKQRNKSRDRQVPEEVIDKQCAKFEWPLPEEYHEIRIFDE